MIPPDHITKAGACANGSLWWGRPGQTIVFRGLAPSRSAGSRVAQAAGRLRESARLAAACRQFPQLRVDNGRQGIQRFPVAARTLLQKSSEVAGLHNNRESGSR